MGDENSNGSLYLYIREIEPMDETVYAIMATRIEPGLSFGEWGVKIWKNLIHGPYSREELLQNHPGLAGVELTNGMQVTQYV